MVTRFIKSAVSLIIVLSLMSFSVSGIKGKNINTSFMQLKLNSLFHIKNTNFNLSQVESQFSIIDKIENTKLMRKFKMSF